MRFRYVCTFVLFFIFTQFVIAQNTFIRMELDVKKMLNPSCNLNMGDVDSNKVYVHLGLCSCKENPPFGPENRDCSDPSQNQLFCTTQITPFQSRVWQHVVGNWGTTPLDDGVGLMTYEGDSVWSFEFIIENYFSDLSLVQDTTFGNDSSIAFSNNLIPYTIGVVFRSYDGFYSGRDNGCNDIFITGIQGDDIQVIQSTDLSIYNAITIIKNVSNIHDNKLLNLNIYPNPTSENLNIRFSLLKEQDDFTINLINMQGAVVQNIFNGRLIPGIHQFSWDNKIHGKKIKAGYYLLDIAGDNYHMTKKVIIK